MKRIALTGGIGTGKTHVLRMIRRNGIPTLDADQVSRSVVDVGHPAHHTLRQCFGDDYFLPNQQVNRPALAKLVFGNQAARAQLESIVHPLIRRLIDDWFARCADTNRNTVAIAEIPLLYETNRAEVFDNVIVVSCAPKMQVARIIKRDKLSTVDAQNRLAAQLPIAQK
ncbi:uncharacterized protein METZ01_LOCUS483030, partial [marine metagenome]